MLPDPYPIQPWTRPCRGSVRVPGSKSLTNRSLVLAALGKGTCLLQEALFSRDTRILCQSLKALGFAVEEDSQAATIRIKGLGGHIPNASASLHVGNAGTAARFLTAMVCLHPGGRYAFDGDEEMRQRPMAGLIHTLQRLGAQFTFLGEADCFPFVMETCGLPGGAWEVDASASSQMLSALMMVAPRASGPVRLQATGARPAFVEMTAGLMRQFGAAIEGDPSAGYDIQPAAYRPPGQGSFAIEPDATAASYFLALPLVVGGQIMVNGLKPDMLQGDIAFASVLLAYGLQLEWLDEGLRVTAVRNQAAQPGEWDFRTFSDTFLTLAAIAPLFNAPTRITGIAHTRHQETDRIHAVTTELRRCGASVIEEPGSITVGPMNGLPSGPVNIRTYHDHRMAMAFAILGCRPSVAGTQPWLQISDPACCGKTFPSYFAVLEDLYRFSHDSLR